MTQANNADEFISKLRSQLAMNQDCGTTHYNLAVALIGKKEYEEAEAVLNDAIGCSPSLAEAYVQLGGLCLNRGDMEGCLYYNTRATKARAGFAPGYANIGFVHLQQGDAEKAIKNLQKAIVHNSKFLQAYVSLANAYMMAGLTEESIITTKKALELEPNFPVAFNNLAIAYMQKEDFASAVEYADKALALGYEVAPEILKELEEHRA